MGPDRTDDTDTSDAETDNTNDAHYKPRGGGLATLYDTRLWAINPDRVMIASNCIACQLQHIPTNRHVVLINVYFPPVGSSRIETQSGSSVGKPSE